MTDTTTDPNAQLQVVPTTSTTPTATTDPTAANTAAIQSTALNTTPTPAPPTTSDANTSSTGTPITQYMANQVQNPTLPTGATDTPVQQQVQSDEVQPNETGITASDAPPVTASSIAASQVDPASVTANFDAAAGQYAATTGNNVAQGTAAQGTVNANDTVQGQLSNLYAQTTNGQIPLWAQGAVSVANQQMAARGMGASSIGAAAITAAVQASALPIASADAQTYFSMDMTNLSNQQQMDLQNTQDRQQGLLSDQAAQNAASQFNASSAQQSNQFLTSLINSIQTNNASMSQAANQYNATEADTVSQYNSTLDYNRAQFNQQQQYAVDQSNVLWRRTVNTQNTAATNAANQVNAQNTLNLSNTALNNLWSQFQDESSWAFTASQNQASINANMAMAANNRSFALQYGQQSTLLGAAGSFVNSIFNAVGSGS